MSPSGRLSSIMRRDHRACAGHGSARADAVCSRQHRMTTPSHDSPAPAPWDPEQYGMFAAPRLRPALDLLHHVPLPLHTPSAQAGAPTPPRPPRSICDLGCGPGEITRLLASRWPAADVVGVDSSDDMLARAHGRGEAGSIRWQRGDIAAWRPAAPVDLVYSNAALHWLDDHERLLPHLLEQLAPGGVLAVQMPLSWPIPSHRILRELLAGDASLAAVPAALRERYARPPVHAPETYHRWLAPRVARLDIWTTEYLHVLEGQDPVLAWVQGSALRPILAVLDEADRTRFLTVYGQRLAEAYPAQGDGKTLFPFPRLFLVATV
jgi:trans-aconitate 2-methyltransferase